MDQLNQVIPQLPGKHPDFGGKKRKREADELNWRKKIIFWELPYRLSLLLRHNLDVMHVEKNMCDSLSGIIMKIDGKSKDTNNARFDLTNLNIRPELHMVKDGNKWIKPVAKFTMLVTDRQKFCSFIKSVRFPDAFAANLRKNITGNDIKITNLKSHDCHVLMQRLLPAGLRPFLN